VNGLHKAFILFFLRGEIFTDVKEIPHSLSLQTVDLMIMFPLHCKCPIILVVRQNCFMLFVTA